jgi:hypothetical protein
MLSLQSLAVKGGDDTDGKNISKMDGHTGGGNAASGDHPSLDRAMSL